MSTAPPVIAPLLAYYINSAHAANLKGDFPSAKKWCQHALAIDSGIAEIWFNLALAERGLGNSKEAVHALKKIPLQTLQSSEAQNSVGLLFTELGEAQHAETALLRAIDLTSSYAPAHSNLGRLYQLQGRLAEAAEHLHKAVDLSPETGAFHINLCSILLELDDPVAAAASGRRAVTLAPEDPRAWSNLGAALDALDHLAEAIESYDRALALQPDCVDALFNKGNALGQLGRTSDALEKYKQVIELVPSHAEAQLSIGKILFAQGNFRGCWERLEHRWGIRDEPPRKLQFPQPIWDGHPATNSLLLWGEQGVGDQILYASTLPDMAHFPQEKYVALDKRLIPLFKRSMPGFEFIDLAQIDAHQDFAEHYPLGSLPRLFRPTRESFARERKAYLRPAPQRTGELRRQLTSRGRPICGISWSSGRKKSGPIKSIPLEQLAASLASLHLDFIDLQYGDTESERKRVRTQSGFIIEHLDEIDNLNDLDSMAALIDACDVIVTISNTTAHLAGALGKETLLLLPCARGKLWYWAGPDGHNLWYPSVRSFHQLSPGDWSHPIAAVQQYLERKSWN